MRYTKKDCAKEILDRLEKLLTERIEDLRFIHGSMALKHSLMFYRTFIWDAKKELK